MFTCYSLLCYPDCGTATVCTCTKQKTMQRKLAAAWSNARPRSGWKVVKRSALRNGNLPPVTSKHTRSTRGTYSQHPANLQPCKLSQGRCAANTNTRDMQRHVGLRKKTHTHTHTHITWKSVKGPKLIEVVANPGPVPVMMYVGT